MHSALHATETVGPSMRRKRDRDAAQARAHVPIGSLFAPITVKGCRQVLRVVCSVPLLLSASGRNPTHRARSEDRYDGS